MKPRSFRICSLFAMMVLASLALAANPRGTAELTLNGKKVSVEYGRPSLGTRTAQELLGQLSPGGKPWRLGADKSTTFSTEADLDFGGATVPQGTYSIWVRKAAGSSFELVFNKQHGQWGTSHDKTQDLVAAPLKEETEKQSVDQLTLEFEKESGGGEFTIQWGNLELVTTFKAK